MSRNKKINEKIKDARRGQILSYALRPFAIKGFAATKISALCEATNISKGLFYLYFPSKEAIFTELIGDAFDKINTACRELEALPISPPEKIKLAIEGLLRDLAENENSALYYLLVAQATVSDATPKKTKEIIHKENNLPYEVITRIITEGQKAGTIHEHDPDEMALVFWTSVSGLAINKAVHGNKFKAPDPSILTNIFLKDI